MCLSDSRVKLNLTKNKGMKKDWMMTQQVLKDHGKKKNMHKHIKRAHVKN